MTAKLANIYYNDHNIEQSILGQEDETLKQVFPGEILTTSLETGQLDAIAAYRHEAIAKDLPYITYLPKLTLEIQYFLIFIKRHRIL